MTVDEMDIPKWMDKVPLAFDWCVYNGEVYFASINYDESEKRQKAVFDLAHCATVALNGIFIKQRVWSAKRFQPWTSSTWGNSIKI